MQSYSPTNRIHLLLIFSIIILNFSIQSFAQNQFEFNFLWEENVFPHNPYNVHFDDMDRPYFYVSSDNGGVKFYKKEGTNDPSLVQTVGSNNWANMKVMDLTQQGNYLYLALGSFFGADEKEYGIAIIDIENPEMPVAKDFWANGIPKKGSAEIKVSGNYAFLGAMNSGLYIFDISNSDEISEVSNYLPNPDFPIENPNAIQEPNVRGLFVKDNLVYVAYDAGGLSIVDISTIETPVEIGRYINTDLSDITQQAYNNVEIYGNYAYIANDYCGLEIVDISEPTNIQHVNTWNPWGCETANNNWANSDGHANQIGFLPGQEGKILIFNANDVELVAMDVTNPNDLQILDTYGNTGDNIRTWGLGIGKDYIAGAYYFTLLPWASSEAKVKLFSYDLITSSKEIQVQNFEISPNPTSSFLDLSFGKNISQNIQISICDSFGKNVFNQNRFLENGKLDLDLSSLNLHGLFFLQVIMENQIFTKKIIVL